MGYDVGDEEIMRHSQQGLSLLGILISIILILLLVYGVVSLNNKNSNTISTLNYEMQQQNFQHNLALIRTQWMLERRPSELTYAFYDELGNTKNNEVFTMSDKGWPTLMQQDKDYCLRIFKKITNTLLDDDLQRIIKVTMLQKEGDISCQFCDAGDSNTCFNYSTY